MSSGFVPVPRTRAMISLRFLLLYTSVIFLTQRIGPFEILPDQLNETGLNEAALVLRNTSYPREKPGHAGMRRRSYLSLFRLSQHSGLLLLGQGTRPSGFANNA